VTIKAGFANISQCTQCTCLCSLLPVGPWTLMPILLRVTYHQWCALPTNRALTTHSPYNLPKSMFLDLPHNVIRIRVARFRLRVHTLRYETTTWAHGASHSCDTCQSIDRIQDEEHVLFHCLHPIWFLFAGKTLLYLLQQRIMFLPFCTSKTSNSLFHS